MYCIKQSGIRATNDTVHETNDTVHETCVFDQAVSLMCWTYHPRYNSWAQTIIFPPGKG